MLEKWSESMQTSSRVDHTSWEPRILIIAVCCRGSRDSHVFYRETLGLECQAH
jgi:hypothetical protein